MVRQHVDADLERLRQFLRALEADAHIAVGDIDFDAQEIEVLKSEIAHLESVLHGGHDCDSKAFLFQMAIDYGAARPSL